MGNLRKEDSLLSGVMARQARAAWIASFLLAFTGCTAGPPAFTLPEDFVSQRTAPSTNGQAAADDGSTSKAKEQDQPAKEAAKSGPSKPRTFPEALHAYLKCLRCPKPPSDKDVQTGAEQVKADQKEDRPRNNSKDQGNQKDEKSRPAAGSPQQRNSGGKGQDQEKAQGKEDEAKAKKEKEDKEEKDKDEKDKQEKKDEAEASWYSAHAQATMVTQAHDHFHSPYVGPHSLLPLEPAATSLTGTLFLDARLWECNGSSTELIFNPEIAGGRGLSGVLGIGGFPNGDITRVAAVEPTPYFARLFVRQTFGLGGEQETVEVAPNQIGGKRDIERISIVVGKLAATDLVDDNRYSHDPRTQFLNWSLMYNGAWDYPSNVRGYSYGVGIDVNHKDWAFRYGIFAEPRFANSAALDPRFLDANGQVMELEERYTLCCHPGKLRLLGYLNHAHMGNYREALAEMPVDPDIALTRAYRFKYGFGANLEQELTKELGLFARLGWNDGHSETWAFTEIDRTAAVGLLLKGRCWCRPQDQVGLAVVANGLSAAHRDYLAAGGLGFIIGDGRLNYGPEEILETYYNLEVRKGIIVTADFQEVNHPAYNRDRGPVSIATLRVHIEL